MAKGFPASLRHGVIALVVFVLPLFAEQPVELIAQSVEQEGNRTIAKGDVLLRSEGRFLRSDRLILCRETQEAELFGNVYLSQPNEDLLTTDYLKLSGEGDRKGWVDNLYTVSAETGLWLAGSEGNLDGNLTSVRRGSVSGCPAAHPDWSIRFSTAEFDRGKEWVDLYNPRFYAGRVPVFYMPYFGYSTNMNRRSGFLFPRFGRSSEEGTLLEIPYYLAPYNTWDFEFWPQTRSDRGDGVAGTFRFVDSAHSKGAVNLGQFKDKPEFAAEKGIAQPEHWGLTLDYERSRLFTRSTSTDQEGLLLYYQDYSDIEYVQLESVDPDKRDREISALITNKADYFYKTDSAYLGFYSRFFKDLKNPDNDDTIVHILPESHGHLFTRSLYFDNLLVGADLKHRNFERKEGLEATDWRLRLPVGYHVSLFNDYLLASALWQLDHYRINYTEPGYEPGIEEHQQVSLALSTLLARPYENFFHTFGLGVTYNDPLSSDIEGYFDSNFSKDAGTETSEYSTASLKLSQYLYDAAGRAFLTHRLSQPMILDDNSTLLSLENELILSPTPAYSLRNVSRWSHEYDALISSSTTLAKSGAFNYSLTYLYENKTGQEVSNRYLSTSAGYQLSSRHKLSGDYARDLLEKEDRGWQIAHTYNKGCWQTHLSFTRKITPYAVSGGETDSRINDIIFLKLTLVPFGEMEQQLYERERL